MNKLSIRMFYRLATDTYTGLQRIISDGQKLNKMTLDFAITLKLSETNQLNFTPMYYLALKAIPRGINTSYMVASVSTSTSSTSDIAVP